MKNIIKILISYLIIVFIFLSVHGWVLFNNPSREYWRYNIFKVWFVILCIFCVVIGVLLNKRVKIGTKENIFFILMTSISVIVSMVNLQKYGLEEIRQEYIFHGIFSEFAHTIYILILFITSNLSNMKNIYAKLKR